MKNKVDVLLLTAGAFTLGCITVFMYINYTADHTQRILSFLEIFTKIGAIGGGAVAFIFAYWRAKLQDRQTCVSEQKLFTERFIEASEKLQSESEQVRIAAIILLWNTANASKNESDKHTAIDLLSSFLRIKNYYCPDSDDRQEIEFENEVCGGYEIIEHGDSLVAIRSIAKLSALLAKDTSYRINLSAISVNNLADENCMFKNINFSHSRFIRQSLKNVAIIKSGLEKFRMINGVLSNCQFEHVNLKESYFTCCTIEQSKFDETVNFENSHFDLNTFNNIEFKKSNLKGCAFKDGLIKNTCFYNTNMTDCRFRGVTFENVNFNNAFIEDKQNYIAIKKPFTRDLLTSSNTLESVVFI